MKLLHVLVGLALAISLVSLAMCPDHTFALGRLRVQVDLLRAVSPGLSRSQVIERLGKPTKEAAISPEDRAQFGYGDRPQQVLYYSTTNPHLAFEDVDVFLDSKGYVVAVIHRF